MHPWHPVSVCFAWFTSRGRFKWRVAQCHGGVRSMSSVWHPELRENPWKSTKINENQRKSMKIYENQWKFMFFDDFVWELLAYHVSTACDTSILNLFQELSWCSNAFRGTPGHNRTPSSHLNCEFIKISRFPGFCQKVYTISMILNHKK